MVSILVIYRPTGLVETPLLGLVGTLWPLSSNYVPTNPVVFQPTQPLNKLIKPIVIDNLVQK